MNRVDRCRRCLAVSLVALLWATHPVAAQETHSITFTRPMEVGQTYVLHGEAMLRRSTIGTAMGQRAPAQNRRFVLRLDSEYQVLGVDEHGRPIRARHLIRKCVLNMDGYERELAPPGTTLSASVDEGETDVTLEGRSVDEETETILKMLAGVDESHFTEDELFGSAEPRQPGDEWLPNLDKLHEDLERQSEHSIPRDAVSGAVKFLETRTFGGETCLLIESDIKTDTVPGLDLPDGLRLVSGNMTATAQSLFPVDESLPCLFRSIRLDIDADITGREDQPPTRLRSESHVVVNLQLTPVTATSVATGATPEGGQP